MQLYLSEILYFYMNFVPLCILRGRARLRYAQKGWKHHILEQSSSGAVPRNITGLCPTKTRACTHGYPREKEKGRDSKGRDSKGMDSKGSWVRGHFQPCKFPRRSRSAAWQVLPVAVVVVVVVAPQGCQAPQADGVGEKDLCASIHPHLQAENREGFREQPGETTLVPNTGCKSTEEALLTCRAWQTFHKSQP